jgi:hypothetical protein
MWIADSYLAKTFVWLAAALMPFNMLLAGACGCGDRIASGAPAISITVHQNAIHCCGRTVCKCHHNNINGHKSACCKNKTEQPISPRSTLISVCVCPGGQTPASQTTLPNSSVAKQLVGQAHFCLGPMAVVDYPSPLLSSINNGDSFPATPLERLSNFCRLVI